jgi:hypothetical protein
VLYLDLPSLIGSKPAVSARIVANAIKTICLSAKPTSFSALSTNGKFALMFANRRLREHFGYLDGGKES